MKKPLKWIFPQASVRANFLWIALILLTGLISILTDEPIFGRLVVLLMAIFSFFSAYHIFRYKDAKYYKWNIPNATYGLMYPKKHSKEMSFILILLGTLLVVVAIFSPPS